MVEHRSPMQDRGGQSLRPALLTTCLTALLLWALCGVVVGAPDEEGASPRGGPSPLARGPRRASWRDPLSIPRAEAAALAKRLFLEVYGNYTQHAFPHDDLRPLSCRGSASQGDIAITLLDALDGLLVMGEKEAFVEAARWVGSGFPASEEGNNGSQGMDLATNQTSPLPLDQSSLLSPLPLNRSSLLPPLPHSPPLSFSGGGKAHVFETTIRALGGLLSAHTLAASSSDPEISSTAPGLLRAAQRLGRALARAFDTPSGLPTNHVRLQPAKPASQPAYSAADNLRAAAEAAFRYLSSPFRSAARGAAQSLSLDRRRRGLRARAGARGAAADNDSSEDDYAVDPKERETCAACAGTLVLEMGTLSAASGELGPYRAAREALQTLVATSGDRALPGNTVDVVTGQWVRRDSGIGAGVDSYYEYLLKAFLVFGDERYLHAFTKAYLNIQGVALQEAGGVLAAFEAIRARSEGVGAGGGERRNDSTASPPPRTHPALELPSAGQFVLDFQTSSGMPAHAYVWALSAFWPGLEVLAGRRDAARSLHARWALAWRRWGGLPEMFDGALRSSHPSLVGYPLRPEHAESSFVLDAAFDLGASYGGDYQRAGMHMLATLAAAKGGTCGPASVADVRTGVLDDAVESFFLAETTKYLYLLFRGAGALLDHYVLSTEAHPLLPLEDFWDAGCMLNAGSIFANSSSSPANSPTAATSSLLSTSSPSTNLSNRSRRVTAEAHEELRRRLLRSPVEPEARPCAQEALEQDYSLPTFFFDGCPAHPDLERYPSKLPLPRPPGSAPFLDAFRQARERQAPSGKPTLGHAPAPPFPECRWICGDVLLSRRTSPAARPAHDEAAHVRAEAALREALPLIPLAPRPARNLLRSRRCVACQTVAEALADPEQLRWALTLPWNQAQEIKASGERRRAAQAAWRARRAAARAAEREVKAHLGHRLEQAAGGEAKPTTAADIEAILGRTDGGKVEEVGGEVKEGGAAGTEDGALPTVDGNPSGLDAVPAELDAVLAQERGASAKEEVAPDVEGSAPVETASSTMPQLENPGRVLSAAPKTETLQREEAAESRPQDLQEAPHPAKEEGVPAAGPTSAPHPAKEEGVPAAGPTSVPRPAKEEGVPAVGPTSAPHPLKEKGAPAAKPTSVPHPAKEEGVPAAGPTSVPHPAKEEEVPAVGPTSAPHPLKKKGAPAAKPTSVPHPAKEEGVPAAKPTSAPSPSPAFLLSHTGAVVERQFACSLGTASFEGPGQPERLVCESLAELPAVPNWAAQFGKYLPPSAIVVQVTLSQAPAPAELASVELGRGGHESSLELAAEAAWRCFADRSRGSDGVESDSADGVETASVDGVESTSSSGAESAKHREPDASAPLSGLAVLAWPTKACGSLRNAAAVQGRVAVAVDGDCDVLTKLRHASEAKAAALLVVVGAGSGRGRPLARPQADPWGALHTPCFAMGGQDSDELLSALLDDAAARGVGAGDEAVAVRLRLRPVENGQGGGEGATREMELVVPAGNEAAVGALVEQQGGGDISGIVHSVAIWLQEHAGREAGTADALQVAASAF